MQLPFFVYGTLKPGWMNYRRYLAGHTTAELPATLVGATLYTEGRYPYLVRAPDLAMPDDQVSGALISVAPAHYAETVRWLDWLEGCLAPTSFSPYLRTQALVDASDGPAAAWVYVAGPRTLAAIRAGAMTKVRGGVWRG